MLSAAGIHIDAARLAEARGQLDEALREFRRSSEFDPSNRALASKVLDLELNDEERKATIEVTPDQLSLAIGKGGQNVRLAAKLTGWKIDIKGSEAELAATETPEGLPNEGDGFTSLADLSESGKMKTDSEGEETSQEETVEPAAQETKSSDE